ncbi:OST-HTH/LOTUS domain-containing protein [Roseateles koreensis]|uniref:OST-HTH/LOTUS domain-containing protein n=1 Tax=Roseateles koreensis TaxID=2987526 RepID=A0ABT5KTN5_9BURK|nr:OST-HTH/LOTUS domain-containing protein [Roseateles koreensis]MDC8786298.1 OST-HTH/LOTUS domain-containing protein [Roseateles koreensis]
MDLAATPEQAGGLAELQRAAQNKLGGCLLRLQQYELLLKAMVANTEVAGPPAKLESLREEQIACAQKNTLGGLVGMLTGGYLSSDDSAVADSPASEEPPGNGIWFSFQHRMVMDAERYESTKAGLKELVDLRNELVHHLLQRFDLGQMERCEAAVAYLDRSRGTIDAHYLTLREWAEQMERTRAIAASLMDSPSFKDMLIDGIAPDGQVHWPMSGIVDSLREAEAALSQGRPEGWTELNAAIAWQRQHAPEQTPQRYGCSSWRQVLHESRQFEVKKQVPAEGAPAMNGTVVCYRSLREE